MFSTDGDARRMNLCERRIRKERASFVSAIRGSDVAPARVGREIKNVPVTAGGEHDSIRGVPFNFSGTQAAGHDSLCVSIYDYEIKHLGLREHLHCAGGDLTT